MKIVTLPLPTEVLYADNTNECELFKDYQIDISSINYDDPEMDADKVNYSLVYLRNIDLPLPCDFSKLSYKEKEEWIVKYINADLFDLSIKELNETILNLLADEPINNIENILNEEETNKFQIDHKDLLDSIKQFIVSLRIVLKYAISQSFDDISTDEYPIVEEKPLFFETIHQLIKYYPIIIDAIQLLYLEKYPLTQYNYILHNIEKSSAFYLDFLNLPSVKFIGLLLNDDVKVNKEDNNE